MPKPQATNTLPVVISIVIVLGCLFYLALNKNMQSDELESITGASLIFDGHVPYKDFWQIHTPLFYYLLVPLCFFFKSMKIMYAVRIITFFLLVLNGYFVYVIIKFFLYRKPALFGALSYFACFPVLNIEARPDVLVALFSNLSLLLLLWQRWPPARSFFLSGLSAALALLSKQSGLFCVFSIIIFFIVRSFFHSDDSWSKPIFSKERFNIKNYFFFAAGLLLPCVGFYLLLVHQGAFNAFLQCAVKNDFLNSFLFLKVESVHLYPTFYLKEMFLTNPAFFLSVAALFFYLIFYRERVDRKKLNAAVIVFVFFAVSWGALFMILHAWYYELLLPSQYLVLLAVAPLFFVYEGVFNFFEQRNKRFLGIAFNSAMLLCLCLPPLFHVSKTEKFNLPGSIKRHDQIISLTNKDDKCFSVVPVPFRPSVYFYHIGLVLAESPGTSAQVENTLINEILHDNVVVIVPDKRYRGMERLKSVISDNYIMYGKSFYVPGKILNAGASGIGEWNVLVGGYYKVRTAGTGIFLDHKFVRDGDIYFEKGRHIFYFPNNQRACQISYDLQANKKIPQ